MKSQIPVQSHKARIVAKKAQKRRETSSCNFSPKMKVTSHVILAKSKCFRIALIIGKGNPQESNQFSDKINKIPNKCNIDLGEKNLSISQIYP